MSVERRGFLGALIGAPLAVMLSGKAEARTEPVMSAGPEIEKAWRPLDNFPGLLGEEGDSRFFSYTRTIAFLDGVLQHKLLYSGVKSIGWWRRVAGQPNELWTALYAGDYTVCVRVGCGECFVGLSDFVRVVSMRLEEGKRDVLNKRNGYGFTPPCKRTKQSVA